MSGGSSQSTSSPSTSRVKAASAVETSSCGSVPKTWPASVPRSSPGRSTCSWGMMRTPPDRAEWWQIKAAWLSSGGTRGHAGSGSSSSVRRKASARSHKEKKMERKSERERNSSEKLSGWFQIKWVKERQRTMDREETVYVAAFLCRSMKRII